MLEQEGQAQIEAEGFRLDYLQICCSDTLIQAQLGDTEITILGAMYTHSARLIDNVSLALKGFDKTTQLANANA